MSSSNHAATKTQNQTSQLTQRPTPKVGVILLCIHSLAAPFQRGFFCDDESIRYPYRESTVSSGLCYALGSGVNIILIVLLEYRLTLKQAQSYYGQAAFEFPMKLYAQRVYMRILIWFLGAISSELFTDVSKVTAGRLRPHFVAVCQPQVNGQSLDEYCSSQESRYHYIESYRCASNSPKLRDIRLSFMSGHSSYSAYSAAHAVVSKPKLCNSQSPRPPCRLTQAFGQLYIQSSLCIEDLGLIKHALQLLIALAAFYTGLTRVSDYKHHWQDVLTGLLQGTTVASLVSLYLWPAYEKAQQKHIKYSGQRVASAEQGDELDHVAC